MKPFCPSSAAADWLRLPCAQTTATGVSGSSSVSIGTINVNNGGNSANGWFEIASGASYTASALNVRGGVLAVMHMTGGQLAIGVNIYIGGAGSTSEYFYMSGGTLSYLGRAQTASTETVGGINLAQGVSTIGVTAGGTGVNSADLTVGSINRTAGSGATGGPSADDGSAAASVACEGGA